MSLLYFDSSIIKRFRFLDINLPTLFYASFLEMCSVNLDEKAKR